MYEQEYHEDAMRTKADYNSPFAQLDCAVKGLTGETGELIEHLKKHQYQGHALDLNYLEEELGDIRWYWNLAVDALTQLGDEDRFTLDGVLWRNILKLMDRYPEGFSPERSINREDS